MNIIECKEMKRIKKHNLIPTVIDHIFTICKEDSSFDISNDIKSIDKKIIYADKKISKQKSLTEQASNIKKDLSKKIKRIDDESFKIKYRILETLGSDI